MFTKLKNYLGLIGAALAALWLYITAYKNGRVKGQQETIKEVNRAEKQRQAKQERIDNIHNNAIKQAMDVDKDNTVDNFNSMFKRPDHTPKK